MKKLTLLLLLCPTIVMAQSRDGWYAGAGLGYSHYVTHWYYHRSDGNPRHDNYPTHIINRAQLALGLEKHTIIKTPENAGNFDFDANGEFIFGFAGKTKADWITGEPTASSGGFSAGLNGQFKALLILEKSKGLSLAPFIGLGPQFIFIRNNGKDIEGSAKAAYYDYGDGWNEFLGHLVFSAGINIQTESFTLVPELRVGFAGFSSSSWSPNEDGVSQDGTPAYFGFGIKLLRRL
jgi:hypothetical protein